MAEIMETPEVIEKAEQAMSPELLEQLQANYQENIQEAMKAGNQDMVDYYKEQLAKLNEQAADADGEKLGGWHAGYTANEWREMAKKEYVKNGDSMNYKRYCDNAMKASG